MAHARVLRSQQQAFPGGPMAASVKRGIEIMSFDDFKIQMDRFIAAPGLIRERGNAAAKVVEEHTGATKRVMNDCF